MRLVTFSAGMAAAALAAPASVVAAEPPAPPQAAAGPWRVERERPTTVSDLLARLDRDARFAAGGTGPAGDGGWTVYAPAREVAPTWAATNRDIWYGGEARGGRLRLRTEGRVRRADGSPLPPGPLDAAAYDAEHYDLTYTRGWTGTLGQTENGLDVTLTPHLGVGVGSRGQVTEAGATLKIGRDLDRLVPEGEAAFGRRARWYVYAAGSGRAVGYNWARDRDGGYNRSGVSHDSGAFLGDASLGVALRRGPVHSSIGLVYREIEAEGLRAGHGVDTDVSEGLVAFQLSIKPE